MYLAGFILLIILSTGVSYRCSATEQPWGTGAAGLPVGLVPLAPGSCTQGFQPCSKQGRPRVTHLQFLGSARHDVLDKSWGGNEK